MHHLKIYNLSDTSQKYHGRCLTIRRTTTLRITTGVLKGTAQPEGKLGDSKWRWSLLAYRFGDAWNPGLVHDACDHFRNGLRVCGGHVEGDVLEDAHFQVLQQNLQVILAHKFGGEPLKKRFRHVSLLVPKKHELDRFFHLGIYLETQHRRLKTSLSQQHRRITVHSEKGLHSRILVSPPKERLDFILLCSSGSATAQPAEHNSCRSYKTRSFVTNLCIATRDQLGCSYTRRRAPE